MRIGTWNLEGKWSLANEAFMVREECDVWLLTEVHPSASLPGCHKHFSKLCMAPGQHYAAILSKSPIDKLPDPHPASAAAEI